MFILDEPGRGQAAPEVGRGDIDFGIAHRGRPRAEATGLVPTIGWRKQHFKTAIDRLWKPGNSIKLAIGAGRTHRHEMQMARLALLANGAGSSRRTC